MDINLKDYCAVGCNVKEEMIKISEQVSLKVITFKKTVQNDNPSVLFVPGWISMIDGWKEVLLEMTKDFDVYYVETREKISSIVFGKVEYSVESIAEDIAELIDKLNQKEKKYILFGSSLGATAIIEACTKIKTNPLCLILIGPNAEFRIPNYGKVLLRLFYPPMYNFFKPYVKWYLKKFRLDVKNDAAQYEKYSNVLDYADPWKLKYAAKSVSNYKIWNQLKNVSYSTLIIGASKDKLHEPENTKKIVEIIKHSTFVDMETNKNTHSREVVDIMRDYIASIK